MESFIREILNLANKLKKNYLDHHNDNCVILTSKKEIFKHYKLPLDNNDIANFEQFRYSKKLNKKNYFSEIK